MQNMIIAGRIYEVVSTQNAEQIADSHPNLFKMGLVEITMLRGKRGGHRALYRQSNGNTWSEAI